MKKYTRKIPLTDTIDNPIQELTLFERQIADDLGWIEHMNSLERFSKSWMLEALKEITFQCMGKRNVTLNDNVSRIYKERSAIRSIELMAQIQGIIGIDSKGNVINQINMQSNSQPVIESQSIKQINATPDDYERTATVLRILCESGAMQPEPQDTTQTRTLKVHTA